MMLLCDTCIEALRSRGEIVGVINPFKISIEECEEYERTCEWCGEIDDLHECDILGNIY